MPTNASHLNGCRWAVVALAFAATFCRAAAAPDTNQPPRVFIGNSYHRGFWWSDAEMRGVIEGLRTRWPNLMPHVEYLDAKRHPGRRNLVNFSRYVAEKYGKPDWDLVVAIDGPALQHAYENPLWIDNRPLVFCGVNRDQYPTLSTLTNVTGVIEAPDEAGTFRLARRLLPQATNFYCLGWSGRIGSFRSRWEAESRDASLNFHAVHSVDPPALLRQFAALPPNSVIIELGGLANAGGSLLGPEFKQKLARQASAPIFKNYELRGVPWGLGGRMIDAERHGRLAAELALRILDGEPAASIPFVVGQSVQTVVDHGEMVRFGIPFSRLPPDAVIRNSPPPLHRRYRTAFYVLGGFVTGLALLAAFLARANRRRQVLFAQASDAILILDAEGRITESNAAAARMFGLSERELAGHRFVDLIEPDDLLASPFEMAELLRSSGRRTRRELLGKGGGRIIGDCNFSILPARRVQVIIRDNTEREAAEARLRQSEERFRLASEAVEEVIYERDLPGGGMHRSAAVQELTGYDLADCKPTQGWWEELIHPQDREMVHRKLAAALQSGDDYSLGYRIRHKDGHYVDVWDRGRIARDDNGRAVRVIGATANVSRLRDLESQLRQARKMEAIGTLAGGIAHDFNNILTGIMGNAELASLEAEPGGSIMESLDEIRAASRRARDLVEQILTFSRREAGVIRHIDLRQPIAEAQSLLRATLPPGVEIDVEAPDDLPTVPADPTQVYQLAVNLGSNAAHAMNDKPGRIRIRLAEREFPDLAALPLDTMEPGRYVMIEFEDDGAGMSPEVVERVFDPFFTTKGPGEGTGLGLSVVHGIVRNHRGEIQVESAIGEGTTVRIYLPCGESADAEPPAPEPEPATEKPLQRGAGQHLLVVEDEAPLRRFYNVALSKAGFEVSLCQSGSEALERLSKDPGHFDLVLTDLSMPGMMGIELANRIRQVRADMPIILVTGNLRERTTEEVRDMGFADVLMKPLSITDLTAAAEKALNGGSPRVNGG